MPLKQLDSENADRDLTSQVTVLTHTPDASHATLCIVLVQLGDGTKNLDGSGGDFELTITVGGQTVQPDPQTVTFSTAPRAAVWSTIFPVPANAAVVAKVKSPNGADTDVDVTAAIYEVTYALPDVAMGVAGGLAGYSDVPGAAPAASAIADAVWDEALAGHASAGSAGLALAVAAAASPPAASAIADAVWDEALSGHAGAGSAGKALADLPEDVWTNATRTLTSPATINQDSLDAGSISFRRGDTTTGTITGLADLDTATEIWLTIKDDYDDADEDALIQITLTGGLVTYAGAPAVDPTQGEITVSVDGTELSFALSALVTAALDRSPDWTRTPKVFDVQTLIGTTIATVAIGTCTILPDVTRATDVAAP